MKQGVLVALIVGIVIVALGIGYLLSENIGSGNLGASTSSDLQKKIDELSARLNALESGGPVAAGGFKLAYVDMFRILESLYSLENEVVKSALQEYQKEETRINSEKDAVLKQFQNGEITLKQRDDKLQELQQELTTRNLELSAPIQAEILKAVRDVGQSRGYAIIIDNPASKLSPIVLDSRIGLADDITQTVIDSLKESLKNEKPQQ